MTWASPTRLVSPVYEMRVINGLGKTLYFGVLWPKHEEAIARIYSALSGDGYR